MLVIATALVAATAAMSRTAFVVATTIIIARIARVSMPSSMPIMLTVVVTGPSITFAFATATTAVMSIRVSPATTAIGVSLMMIFAAALAPCSAADFALSMASAAVFLASMAATSTTAVSVAGGLGTIGTTIAVTT